MGGKQQTSTGANTVNATTNLDIDFDTKDLAKAVKDLAGAQKDAGAKQAAVTAAIYEDKKKTILLSGVAAAALFLWVKRKKK